GFYGLIPNHQTHNLGNLQKTIHELNDNFSEYFEVIPLVVEAKKDEELPNDPNKLLVSGYYIRPVMPEMIHGDLIWIQDTLRHYGVGITLNYPNCTSPKVEGWNLDETIDTIWKLTGKRNYWSKERLTTAPTVKYLVLPPLDWIPSKPD
ncbi:hypothetical protein HY643_02155, partial [Candidatus Woesearchaeota archaeon]|nr:hypothetical protein [Candidatus Woesearchaeota archaeon]